MIKKVLIANRGEIAVRIIRACKELGLKTVAVYSEADKDSLAVQLADEKICIGKAPSQESYLISSRILSAAEITNSEAIHPGYGFLSESPDFAEACEEMKIIFIGPTPQTIRLFGDKLEARKLAQKLGIKTVAGSQDVLKDEKDAIEWAQEIGYPVILKACAGGGGKGMRVVREEKEMGDALAATTLEAKNAFGDGRIYLEKFLYPVRHIEFQVVGDGEGNVIVFPPRECTIQIRHQKIIEKSPPINISPQAIKETENNVLKFCKELKYRNAGTLEFLYADGEFYFMEANTRIQVEHPVTEMITGFDLVKEQIRVAGGAKLVSKIYEADGFAIEARVSALDPENNFIPSAGKITKLYLPHWPFLRIDTYLYEGFTVPNMYDPLIAKFIAWGRTFEEATKRLVETLEEAKIEGIKTNMKFLARVLNSEEFLKGDYFSIMEKLKRI